MPAKKKSKSRASSTKKRRSIPATPDCLALFSSLSEYVDEPLQRQICSDVTLHVGECTACVEFLQSLRDTVERMHKSPAGKPTPKVAAHIRRAILDQYRSAVKAVGKTHACATTASACRKL